MIQHKLHLARTRWLESKKIRRKEPKQNRRSRGRGPATGRVKRNRRRQSEPPSRQRGRSIKPSNRCWTRHPNATSIRLSSPVTAEVLRRHVKRRSLTGYQRVVALRRVEPRLHFLAPLQASLLRRIKIVRRRRAENVVMTVRGSVCVRVVQHQVVIRDPTKPKGRRHVIEHWARLRSSISRWISRN